MTHAYAAEFEPLRSTLRKWKPNVTDDTRVCAAIKDLTALYKLAPDNLCQLARSPKLVPRLVLLSDLAAEMKPF